MTILCRSLPLAIANGAFAIELCDVGIIQTIKIYLLVSCMLINTWLVPLIYLDFEVRRDYIAEFLCISRDEPMTMCNGQCYLEDRLKDVTNDQAQGTSSTHRSIPLSWFFQEFTMFGLERPKGCFEKDAQFMGSDEVPQNDNEGIFRPPRIS